MALNGKANSTAAVGTLGAAYPIEQAVVDKNEEVFHNPDRMELRSTNLVWPPLLRKLDRIDPSYRN